MKADGTAYSTPRGRAYDRYINSEEWAAKRQEYWAEYGRSCKVVDCGSMADLQVHHHTYERLGHELLTDLVGLCRAHHQEIHARHDALLRRASLTRITEEVTGLKLRDATQPKKIKKAKKAKTKKRPAARRDSKAVVVGRMVSPLDTVGYRERQRAVDPGLTPKRRQRLEAIHKSKAQKKADARQKVMDQRAARTRAHQQSQKVARRIVAARQK